MKSRTAQNHPRPLRFHLRRQSAIRCGPATLEETLQPCGAQKRAKICAYANNHYAGHGPATVELFQKLWDKN